MAIFIHIPRTAGSAICNHFGLLNSHCTAAQRLVSDPQFMSEYRFTIIRNPWAQAVSFYNLATRGTHKGQYPWHFREWLLNGMPTHWKTSSEYPDDPMDQLAYFTDEKGNDLVVDIFKFEALPAWICRLGKMLNKPTKTLPLYNGMARNWSYQPYYDRDTRGILAERYPQFCERFGYKF